MVNWKIALTVIVIAILAVAIGMWFGYQYVSEQDNISPEGRHKPSNIMDSPGDKPLVLTLTFVRISQRQYYLL
jgi:hypothetical protein